MNPVCRRDEIARTLLPVIESQLSGALGRTLENQRVSIESRFAAHDQFRKIGRELPLPMFSADASGAITWVNRAWLDLHGTQMTDEIGRTVWQRLHPDDIHTNPEELFSVLERNEPLVTELHLRDAAAREHPVLAYLIPLDDTDGQTGLLGVCFDVSVQHELRAALGESEARFRHMANHAPVMIWMTEPDGACTYLNASWYAFTGQNEQTGLGFGWLNAIPPEDRLTFQQAFATAHATGEAFRQEHRLIRADGKICWAIDSAAPRFDASGRLLGYIGSITEITRRKQMEEELREATRISETLNRVGKSLASELELETVMELVTDESLSLVGAEFGACFYHLQNAERAFTLSALKGIREGEFDEFRARHEDDLFEPTFCEGALQRRDDLHSDAEGMIHSEDLHVRSFLAVPILTREGQVRGGLFFGHSRPGQFTPMHEQIVIGIAGQAAVALENARLYGEARDADRRKDEFLAMLAHELRNPLAPIRTGLDLLQMSGTDPDIIEPMQQQLEHLIRLVDDLLDVSRIMRGRVELRITPVELASVISRAVDTVRPLMIAADQRLESSLPEESLWVSGDAVRLAQVLSNLLHNASKYSDAHSKIELTLARENDQAVITIRDYGIGIDPVLLPQVFDLFTQAPTTVDRSQGGLGIGLTITRNLIEMHGGAVEAASDGPGHGSTFRIRLPLIPGGDDTQQTSETVDLQQSLRVLVVDDNRAAARMVALLLAKLGRHQISTAYDGRTALETALRVQPHLIILDIGLPEIDGHEVARRLRRNPDFRDAVLVALTGYGTHQDRENALKAGFDDHLVKPPGIEQLRAVLMHPRLNSPEQTLDSSGASL